MGKTRENCHGSRGARSPRKELGAQGRARQGAGLGERATVSREQGELLGWEDSRGEETSAGRDYGEI